MPGRTASTGEGLRQPHLAELIASELRALILHGELRDGEFLPTQDELSEQFDVGKVAVREALRILENEGLATVRRGNMGGATVHTPSPRAAGRMLAMVMEARAVPAGQLAVALQKMEPLCAAMCAENPDRSKHVVPRLNEILQESAEALNDPVAFTRSARRYHEVLVELCGNEAMVVVVGALETIWSPIAQGWASRAQRSRSYPDLRGRRAALKTHERITSLIEDGEADAAAKLTGEHVHTAQRYSLGDNPNRSVTSDEFG
jgi:GntR family transcriptional repressor for pyruvate dehydrogenase complex